MACLSGTTNGEYSYTDCCGALQSGTSTGVEICYDDGYFFRGILSDLTPCSTNCPTPTPSPTPGTLTKNFYNCCDIGGIIYSAKSGNDYVFGNNIYVTFDASGNTCHSTTLDGPATQEVDDTLWAPVTGQDCSYPECGTCPTPTPTPTLGPTSTQTPTPTTTPTPGPTSTQTPTPTTTPTPGPTSTQTPTPTTTPTATPTPTPTPTRITLISVNEQYATDFIDCCDVSGTTVPSDSYVPHPVWTNNDGDVSIIQLNAVALGGFNGLNN
jgi:hypothetical protein